MIFILLQKAPIQHLKTKEQNQQKIQQQKAITFTLATSAVAAPKTVAPFHAHHQRRFLLKRQHLNHAAPLHVAEEYIAKRLKIANYQDSAALDARQAQKDASALQNSLIQQASKTK